MTLRIERSERDGFIVFVLSGRLDAEYIGELKDLFGPPQRYSRILLDLSDVNLADRESVLFLCHCTKLGLTLKDCPEYIREWMEREGS